MSEFLDFFRKIFLHVKWFFQRVFRGYSDYDLIDYGEFVCKKILPSLKAWIAHERYGYPESAGSLENWNKILNEILWAVEETATEKNEEEIYTHWEATGMTKEERRDAVYRVWERRKEGMKLLGKYLDAMWD